MVGEKVKDVARDQNELVEHLMVKLPGDNREKCSYCALTGTHSRSRFVCEGRGVHVVV
jgi:hypothetical protein